ncbi:HD-GYP domain-containing protein [Kangiella shandongensis]|uniref:HD-GYP domain-containing protein n=1 Tax=Kangiella shandongensis TaxID=2763258 RepID=UPI001CBED684|nr:HD-GYP domain-containing protein [Kangiella shandongensis]
MVFDSLLSLIGRSSKKEVVKTTSPSTVARHKVEKKKIPVSKLAKGMTVVELDRPWTEVPVMFQEITISTGKEIQLLQQYCQHVYIDHHSYTNIYTKQFLNRQQKADYAQHKVNPEEASQKLQEELPRARKTFERSQEHINKLLEDVLRDSKIDIEGSKQLVASCVDSILNNETALFWLSKIKHRDKYTAEHSVRVAILAIAFGKYLQLPRYELEQLGLCGMLHDVGKMKVPQHILNKSGPLSKDEFKLVKEHAMLGYVYLHEHGGISEQICSTAYNHHEQMNSKGYPRQISTEKLSKYDRIIAILDSYDAMISDRCYRNAIPPSKAISELYKGQGSQYDEELIHEFIQMVGIYPIGSLVELNNGQVGIVLSANPDNKLSPVVELITNKYRKPIKPIAINLAKGPKDAQGNPLKVKQTLADNQVNFDLEHLVRSVAA